MSTLKYPGLAMLLALSLIATGLPLVVVNAEAAAHPSITADICHPGSAVNVNAAHCSLPTLQEGSGSPAFPTYARLSFASVVIAQPRMPESPASPPPEPLL